jgi:hypothetical protein
MIISVKEGTKLAKDFVSLLCTAAQKNNHAELMSHLFADKVAWKMVRLVLACMNLILR